MVLQAVSRGMVCARAARGAAIAAGIAAMVAVLGIRSRAEGVGESAQAPDHNARDLRSLEALRRAGLPRGFWLPPALRPAVAHMLDQSPAFRHQCARIIALGPIQIGVTQDSSALEAVNCRAIARIRRYESGIVVADITVPEHDAPYEALAHELEHVIEYLEGVKLHVLAASGARSREIWRGPAGIETRRAIEAGQRVARETNPAVILTSHRPR